MSEGGFVVGRRYRLHVLGTKDSEGRAEAIIGTITEMDGPLITVFEEGRKVSVAGGAPVELPGAYHVVNVYSLGFIRAEALDRDR